MRIEIFSDDIVMNIGVVIFFILFVFLLFIFLTFIASLFVKKKKEKKFAKLPFVSVVVPVYNEEKNIVDCLSSLIKSAYPINNLEIIVVNDQSTDNTLEVTQSFINKHKDIDIKVITGKHSGKSGALNLGMSKSKHDLILSLDADIMVEKNTITALVQPLAEKDVAATNCVAVIRKPKNLIEHFQRIEFFLNNLVRMSFSKVFDNSIWFFGAAACYKKDILKKIGNFKKDTLTEDMDICLELYNSKYKIVTVKEAVITTKACPTVLALGKQRMRWYYGALQSLVKNKALLSYDKRSPSVYFLYFNQFWWTFFAFIFFPLVAYQVSYWWPHGQGIYEALMYIFRWFTMVGPFYVLYMIPVWGISFLNLFGVMSGVISMFNIVAAINMFKGKFTLPTFIAIFFFFPYTIILNAIVIAGVIKYTLSKKKYFID